MGASVQGRAERAFYGRQNCLGGRHNSRGGEGQGTRLLTVSVNHGRETKMNTVAATTGKRSALLSYFSLFTSLGTLLCCALPSLLVLFGLGASVASALSLMPIG